MCRVIHWTTGIHQWLHLSKRIFFTIVLSVSSSSLMLIAVWDLFVVHWCACSHVLTYAFFQRSGEIIQCLLSSVLCNWFLWNMVPHESWSYGFCLAVFTHTDLPGSLCNLLVSVVLLQSFGITVKCNLSSLYG